MERSGGLVACGWVGIQLICLGTWNSLLKRTPKTHVIEDWKVNMIVTSSKERKWKNPLILNYKISLSISMSPQKLEIGRSRNALSFSIVYFCTRNNQSRIDLARHLHTKKHASFWLSKWFDSLATFAIKKKALCRVGCRMEMCSVVWLSFMRILFPCKYGLTCIHCIFYINLILKLYIDLLCAHLCSTSTWGGFMVYIYFHSRVHLCVVSY